MKLNDKARKSYSNVIQVDSYQTVAALRHLGFEMPRRQHYWISEEIDEEFIDDVIKDSVYIYPYSTELMTMLAVIKRDGIEVGSEDWDYYMDELKMQFGVGPSTLESFSATMMPNGRYKFTRHD